MKPTFLLSALLAASMCSHAALAADKSVADKSVADKSVAAPTTAVEAGHDENDGHDHGAKNENDGPTDDLWRRSDAAFHAGDYPSAIEFHRAIVKIDPTDTESYGVGAWLLWSLDKKAEADEFVAEGLKNNAQDSEMWNVAAQQYGLEKEFVLERDAYATAVKLAGKDADQMLVRRFAHASERAGDLKASARIWRGLVADYPNEAVNRNNLARVEAAIKGDDKTLTMGALGVGALFLLAYGARGARKRREDSA